MENRKTFIVLCIFIIVYSGTLPSLSFLCLFRIDDIMPAQCYYCMSSFLNYGCQRSKNKDMSSVSVLVFCVLRQASENKKKVDV